MSISKEDILNDEEFKDFLRAKNIKDSTVRSYIIRLRPYCNFHNMQLSELIEEAEEEQDLGKTKIRRRRVNKRIGEYIDYLESEGKSPQTIRTYFDSIKAIYSFCEIKLGQIGLPKVDNDKTFDKLITLDDVEVAVKEANTRDRAIILLILSSGLSRKDIRLFTYRDFLKAINSYTHTSTYLSIDEVVEIIEKEESVIPTWRGRRRKNNIPYITFSSPESTRAILSYLKFRQGTPHDVTSEDSPLFSLIHNMEGTFLSEKGYGRIFTTLNNRLSFGYKPNGFIRFSSHELRRIFATQCEIAGVRHLSSERFLGHKIDNVTGAYYKVDEDTLRNEYLKVLPYITFDKVKRIKVEDLEVTKLRAELKKAQAENKKMISVRIRGEDAIKQIESLGESLKLDILKNKSLNKVNFKKD